jgi:hypothetical protein
MVVRLPAALYPHEDIWYSFLLDAEYPRAVVQLEGLGKLKNPMTSSGIESKAFQLVS